MAERAEFTLDVSMPSPEGKAVAEEREDGDLVLRGIASDFSLDREGEAFLPGAFQKSIDKFLAGQRPLLYHHDNSFQIGEVTALEAKADGLHFEAVVPKPAEAKALDIYNKIRRGMMKAVSVRGFFKKMGNKIAEADLAEISVTPFPVNSGALFAVAQKAYEGDLEAGPWEVSEEEAQKAMEWLDGRFADLRETFSKLSEQAEASGS